MGSHPQYSFPKTKMKILLLEGIHDSALGCFESAGYQVEQRADAMSEEELLECISDLHILGIRSKTKITPAVLEASRHLLAIGCFCIGTNQVDLEAAAKNGVAVFNAPFSNTRSVAELAIAEIVMLARRTCQLSMQMHEGKWEKTARGSHEVRNKNLGIIGYGHIGQQVDILASAMGMNVRFYDILKKLPLGVSEPVEGLSELLAWSDFVTLHVPETPLTRNMIGAAELRSMKEGACLLNLSRGTVVDIEALSEALRSGHLAGAALDVYPQEPKSNNEAFVSPLQGIPNVILTPHVGGSTLEAQKKIGIEVADALVRFSDEGSTGTSVNIPHIDLPLSEGSHRVLNIHRNEPGVLRDINRIVADMNANILAQQLGTNEQIGYLVMDVYPSLSRNVKASIDELPANVRTRLLF